MAAARSIVKHLVSRGLISQEFEDDATCELHRELSRRSRRVAHALAVMTSEHQLALHAAEILTA